MGHFCYELFRCDELFPCDEFDPGFQVELPPGVRFDQGFFGGVVAFGFLVAVTLGFGVAVTLGFLVAVTLGFGVEADDGNLSRAFSAMRRAFWAARAANSDDTLTSSALTLYISVA